MYKCKCVFELVFSNIPKENMNKRSTQLLLKMLLRFSNSQHGSVEKKQVGAACNF